MAARSSDDLGARIVAVAREWIGTPYCHQASCKGVGSDCLGLIRGVWREIFGPEPRPIGVYSANWGEVIGKDDLCKELSAHFLPTAIDMARHGDILVFRMFEHGPAKHLAVLANRDLRDAGATMIHVYSGHATCEVRLSSPWLRRLAGAYRFPVKN